MTSEALPQTIPSTSTGTPPKERSEPFFTSNTTPAKAPTIPGALDLDIMGEPDPEQESKAPKETEKHPEKHPEKGEASQGRKEATISEPATLGTQAAQSTTQYVSEKVEQIVEYASQAAAAAAAYLPIPQGVEESVASDMPSKKPRQERRVSLPSEELKGAQPREHTGGVGALPGNVSESSVALLPDEREEKRLRSTPLQSAARERGDTIKPSAATTVVPESEQARPREGEIAEQVKTSDKDRRVSSLPPDTSAKASTEPMEAEANRTRLVETSESEKGKKTGADAGVGLVGNVPGVGETGDQKQDEEPSAAPATLDQEKVPPRDQREEGSRQAKPDSEGYGGDYHPAQLHPPPPGAGVAEYRSSIAAQNEGEQEAPPSPTQGRRASGATGKKAGFMAMVKGEMKFLVGKMSGDEEKVAEGRRLMHREG